MILQRYNFESNSQPSGVSAVMGGNCLWYCKDIILKAIHNWVGLLSKPLITVYDTAKI